MEVDAAGQAAADAPGYLGRVLVDDVPVGTCFQAAVGVVVTAWHVLNDLDAAQAGAEVWVDQMRPGAAAQLARVVGLVPGADLAVLSVSCPFADSVPGFALSGLVPPGTEVRVQGFGDIVDHSGFRSLPANGRWTGLALRDDGVRLGVMDSKDIPVGMSGAPVRRLADDAVVGVVSAHYNSPRDGWYRDNVWLSRVEDLIPLLDGLAAVAVDDGLSDVRRYAADVARSARAQPYFEVAAGEAPPLASVYVPQRARAASTRVEDTASGWEAEVVPAEQILDIDEDCLIVAGPGMGKSSLLRSVCLTLADRWAQGGAARELPVRLSAASLADRGSLPELIEAGMRDELHRVVTHDQWSADFFATTPPGARWLLLVDGLDEILDAEDRQTVLGKIAGLVGRSGPSRYRVVLSTRPLDDSELASGGTVAAGWRPRTFELLPFSADDVARLASLWFGQLGVPDPDQETERFTAELARYDITRLADTPLVAAMMCQLKAAAPGQPLPRSRGAVYQQFAEHLRDRLNAKGSQGAAAQAEQAMRHHGQAALMQADRLVSSAHRLLGRWAIARRSGDTRPARDFVLAQPEAERPDNVKDVEWRDFVDAVLRRTGVLDARGGALEFLHHTLADYLAVWCHPDPAGAARDLLRVRRSLQRYWREPRESGSYVGFLLEAGAQGTDLEPLLDQLIRHCASRANTGGLRGLRFIAAQRSLGTALPDSLTGTLAETLITIASTPKNYMRNRLGAAQLLADIDQDQAAALLESLALERTDFDAVRALSAVDKTRAIALLKSVASEEANTWADRRLQAATFLARLDPGQGTGVLEKMARNKRFGYQAKAASAVVGIDPALGVELLQSIADDEDAYTGHRLDAARDLTRLAPDIGISRLASVTGSIITDALNYRDSHWSRWEIRRQGLRGLGLEQSRRQHRSEERERASKAIQTLADADRPHAVELLQAILAQEPGSQDDRRWLAAELDSIRDRPSSKTVPENDVDVEWVRWELMYAPATLQRAQGNAPPVNPSRQTAENLAHQGLVSSLDDPRVTDIIYDIALDKAETELVRRSATFKLAELHDPRGADLLADHANDTTLTPIARTVSAAKLAQLGDPRGMDSLEAMAHDQASLDLALHAIDKMGRVDKARALELYGEIAARIPWWRLMQRLRANFVRFLIHSEN